MQEDGDRMAQMRKQTWIFHWGWVCVQWVGGGGGGGLFTCHGLLFRPRLSEIQSKLKYSVTKTSYHAFPNI